MATFYFNGAVDTNWATLGNWWTNSTFTTPADSLPTSVDDVIAIAIYGLTANGQTVKNFTFTGDGIFSGGGFRGSLTATDSAVLNNTNFAGTFDDGGTLTANTITFNESENAYADIIGDVIFNGGPNYGNITGNVVFNQGNQGGQNSGTVIGNATFNETYSDGFVTGNATFNGGAANEGTVSGDANFNDSSWNNGGTVTGNATFNDNSLNNGTVSGNATFNDASYTEVNASVGTMVLGTRTPSPLRYGINNSNILGMI
jgi:hypothetical protein